MIITKHDDIYKVRIKTMVANSRAKGGPRMAKVEIELRDKLLVTCAEAGKFESERRAKNGESRN